MEQFFVSLDKLARESHLTVAYTPKDLDQFKAADTCAAKPAGKALLFHPPEQGKNQNYFGYDCTKKILYVIILTKPFDRKPKTIYHN